MHLSLTAFNRPEYLDQVLFSLSQCEGIEDCLLFASVEPGNRDVYRLLKAFPQTVQVSMNKEVLGCPANTKKAIQMAFDGGGDFVFHLEDDIVYAPDTLDLVRWMREQYVNDPDVLCVGVKSPDPPDLGMENAVKKDHWFHCTGWGTWLDRWVVDFLPKWEPLKTGTKGYLGWGHTVNAKIMPGYTQVRPLLSRCKHIGQYGGTHATDETFEKDLPRWYAGDVDFSPGGYREVDAA